MKRAIFSVLLVGLAAVFLIAAGDKPQAESVTILFTGGAFGKLKPCACSPESDLGGLLRRDTALLGLAKEFPDALLVDAGGSFKEPSTQAKLGAAAYLGGLKTLGYDVVGVGAGDLLYGRSFLVEHADAGLLASNLVYATGEAPFVGIVRDIQRGGAKVRFVSLIHPKDLYTGVQANVALTTPDDFLRKQTSEDELVVVLTSTTPETARAWLKLPTVDVVINADPAGDLNTEPIIERVGDGLYAESAVFGSRIGVLQLQVEQGAVIDVQQRVVPLDKTFVDGARAKPQYDQYIAETKRMYLDSLMGKPAFDNEGSPYVGQQPCAKCHAAEVAKWKTTPHARGWESLKKVGMSFDPECIACHVVAYGEPGGFHSEAESPHLVDVGCENCHGPAKQHALTPVVGTVARPTMETCLKCHNAERAPRFNPEVGWPKIAH